MRYQHLHTGPPRPNRDTPLYKVPGLPTVLRVPLSEATDECNLNLADVILTVLWERSPILCQNFVDPELDVEDYWQRKKGRTDSVGWELTIDRRHSVIRVSWADKYEVRGRGIMKDKWSFCFEADDNLRNWGPPIRER